MEESTRLLHALGHDSYAEALARHRAILRRAFRKPAVTRSITTGDLRLGEEVPLPNWWGGYVLRPDTIECWENRPSRLHERLRYTRNRGDWNRKLLAP